MFEFIKKCEYEHLTLNEITRYARDCKCEILNHQESSGIIHVFIMKYHELKFKVCCEAIEGGYYYIFDIRMIQVT